GPRIGLGQDVLAVNVVLAAKVIDPAGLPKLLPQAEGIFQEKAGEFGPPRRILGPLGLCGFFQLWPCEIESRLAPDLAHRGLATAKVLRHLAHALAFLEHRQDSLALFVRNTNALPLARHITTFSPACSFIAAPAAVSTR